MKAEGGKMQETVMLRPPLSILLLGDTGRMEFREARTGLDDWGTVDQFDEVDSAATALHDGTIVPDLIVVAQTFPGQFSPQAIDRLRRLAPLARVVGLMGSWCEGEMRTGVPWPAVVRNYWHQWTARSNQQLGRMADGKGCSWTLPPTATEEERRLADSSRHTPCAVRHGTRGLVLIHAPMREMAEWLSAACRSRGYSTVWQRAGAMSCVEGARAAVFDGTDLGQEECGKLQHLAVTLDPVPIIALLAFPRIEDQKRALSAGAAAVVSKPVIVDDLFWELERVSSR